MGKFYVYEHWRPDTNLPFYVGKGGGSGNINRSLDFKRRNKRYAKVIRELTRLGMCAEVKMFRSGLSEKAAFAIEKVRIAFYRGKGIKLANIAKGGQGSSGWHHSEEWKIANGKRQRGRKDSPRVRAKKSAAARKRPKSFYLKGARKISRAVKALWADPVYRSKVIAAQSRRGPITEVTRNNLRKAQRDRRARTKVSAETRARTSASITKWHAARRLAKELL